MRGLFIQAPSLLLNPGLDAALIEAETAADPEAARAEWHGEFREQLSQFLEDELIDRAIVPDLRELPFVPKQSYFAFVDSSGGRHDAMTLAIAHPEVAQFASVPGTVLKLDRLLICSPPFTPEEVVQRFCEQVRGFRLSKVTGDRYAGEWVSTAFHKNEVAYEAAETDKSAIYAECLPLFAQGRVQLLDMPRLATELRLLERRPRAGGRGDSIDHPPRASDDAANAACGAIWLASQKSVRSLTRDPRKPMRVIRNYDELDYYESSQ